MTDIEKAMNNGDQAALDLVRRQIRPGASSRVNFSSPYPNHTPGSSASPSFSSPAPNFGAPPNYNMGGGRSMYQQPAAPGPKFHPSPFYTIVKPLTPVIELKSK